MHNVEGKDFFDAIRSSVKFSHFVASVIPLALLVYFSIQYVYPYVTKGDVTNLPLHIGIVLVLAVAVSVLGLVLSTRATNSSIGSAQDLNRKLNSLFDITRQFRETLFPDELLEYIMDSAMGLLSAEWGVLMLYDEEKQLKIKVSSGTNVGSIKNMVVTSDARIAVQVAETGKPVRINDVSGDNQQSPDFAGETGLQTRSILCVPLIHSNEIIGVIELRNKKYGRFTYQDEALLHNLADQASISIAQNSLNERQQSDFIHITEILVGTQDHMQDKKGHARRVANYANRIGKLLNCSESELKRLYYACLFHDIGFMKIDMSEQWDREKIMQHPRLGYDLIRRISLWRDSADIILHHHERYDGTGYPLEKKKDEIPLGARILFVADVFDVLTSKHSYQKKQLTYEGALEEIEANSGTQFDPVVVEKLKSAIGDTDILDD